MERVNKLLSYMNDNDMDCAVITDRANVRYLSGFTGSAGYLIISEEERLLITDFRYTEQASIQAKGFKVIDCAEFDRGEYAKSFSSTGFEDTAISYTQYKGIEKDFGNLIPLGNTIINMRSIKTADEVESIRKATKIADDAFSYILTIIKAGMTEIEVAREIDFYMLRNGADALSFDTIVASGERGSMPHATPGNNIIKNGDLVVMDFGCVCNGYCSDMTRTIGIGAIDEECKKAYDTVLSAQLTALDKIKAGVNCAEVHGVAFDIINSAYPNMFGHALGHGVGLEIHEQPTFSKRSDYPLAEGAVITVEPGVYIPGKCGVRIEDLVLVTADGYENMTASPKELIII